MTEEQAAGAALARMGSRRVLITGISTYWGGRLAQALEQRPEIEAVIGVDSNDPTRELERTEFVRVGTQHALLRRIVLAAEIDTVVDTRLIVDSTVASAKDIHENNVVGTMNILAACAGSDSTVRKFVFKSSSHYYGAEQDDPAFFTEAMRRPHPPQTAIERDIVEAEAAVRDFAEKNAEVELTVLRFANASATLGPTSTVTGAHARPGRALAHAVTSNIPGTYNVGADGILSFTEVVGLLGKSYVPVLPPVATGLAAAAVRRLGLDIPPEMLGQLRFGRGMDNRKLKATAFGYRYTTREAVIRMGEHMRLHPILRDAKQPYRYEEEVEEFLRWSPNVRDSSFRRDATLRPGQVAQIQKSIASRSGHAAAPVPGYTDLDEDEIVALLPSLEPVQLHALREHERAAGGRERVLSALDQALGRAQAAPR